MQAFYPLKFKLSAPKASRPGSTSIFPCPWRRQSACKPAKKSSGNCWIALNYTWYENSYLSSKPLKGQAKATKLLCRPPQNRLPKTNGAAAPTQVAPDPPVRENLIHDFLSAYEILGLKRVLDGSRPNGLGSSVWPGGSALCSSSKTSRWLD